MEQMKKKGIVNGILSNALPNLKDTADAFGLINENRIFCSFDLGLLKPDPRIYESMREKLGCAFGEILFIDDKPANVEAAQALGINALVFNDGTAEKDVSRLMGWGTGRK